MTTDTVPFDPTVMDVDKALRNYVRDEPTDWLYWDGHLLHTWQAHHRDCFDCDCVEVSGATVADLPPEQMPHYDCRKGHFWQVKVERNQPVAVWCCRCDRTRRVEPR